MFSQARIWENCAFAISARNLELSETRRRMISLNQPQAELFIPDKTDGESAMPRTTHLGVGAHQDDLEFMALHGILECFQREDRWFGGVTCTNGAGCARSGPYAEYTDEQMRAVRQREQRTASVIGQYSFMAQLDYPSGTIKQSESRGAVVADLIKVLEASQPEVVYTHNPADKHATHVAVFLAVLEAIRALPRPKRPRVFHGCEMWRGLDWLADEDKVILPLSSHPNLAASLNGVFDSQIVGGKRYDLAVEGRRLANATFLDSHSVDTNDRVTYALDLTPLLDDDAADPLDYLNAYIDQLRQSVRDQMDQLR